MATFYPNSQILFDEPDGNQALFIKL